MVAKRPFRKIDFDPAFDNTKIELGSDASFPYRPENTYKIPNGDMDDYRKRTESLNHLQKHAAFFDADCDGVIWPKDTFFGFLTLGFGFFLSAIAVLVVHGPFSYPTIPKRGDKWTDYLPDPYLRIWIANLHRCKHGSDSETFDRRGDFQASKFDQVLESYSSHYTKEALSLSDGVKMILTRRDLMDLFGIFAFIFEWGSTYMLLWPKDGYMKKDEILGVLDGSIFPVIAQRNKAGTRAGAFVAK
ncbi:Caleosin-domain-containing protein [Violaceomyces palustris]|uniref:Caleosin-domain-containing protein n=1 Tax=Violaceomyces palustris TaxID=1673888 RepID=A0ACD0P879_9BASI|nr:Caleosin-domain-containing protein [Violaceomyces palustris]